MSQMTMWNDDEMLMADLDEALQGAVSDSARAAARAAFAWRTIDDDLMSLAYDSSLTAEVLVRSVATTPRVIGFQATDFTLEIELDAGTLMDRSSRDGCAGSRSSHPREPSTRSTPTSPASSPCRPLMVVPSGSASPATTPRRAPSG